MTTLEKLQKFLTSPRVPNSELPWMAIGIRPHIVCKDGYELSVQASSRHYCTPRKDRAKFYVEVEVGFPSYHDDLLGDDNDCGVYACVPVENVAVLIDKHGGMSLKDNNHQNEEINQ